MVSKKSALSFGLLAASLILSANPGLCDYVSGGLILFKSKPAVLAKANTAQRFSEYAHLQPGEDDVTLSMVFHNGGGGRPAFDWVEIASASMQTVYVKKDQFVNGEYKLDVTGKLGDGYNQFFISGSGPAGASLSWCLLTPTPTVTGLSAEKTGANQKLAINGSNLPTSAEMATVTVDGKKATVLSATASAITFRTPTDLRVGQSNVQLQFCSFTSKPLPVTVAELITLTAISAEQAYAGMTVTISGTGFSTNPEDDVVYIGPRQASVISATPTELQITVPNNFANMVPQMNQPVEVQVKGQTAKNKLLLSVMNG